MIDLTLGIPLYRSAAFLPELLARLEQLTLSPRELIFVDDASPDDSGDVAARFIATRWKGPARIVRHPINLGIAAAYNRVALEACSEWIHILDADDYPVSPDYYNHVKSRLDSDIDLLVTSLESNSELLDRGARLVAPWIPTKPPAWLPLLGSVATRSGVVYRRSLLLAFPFPEPAYPGSDVAHLAVLRQRFRCRFDATARVHYTIHPGASSAQQRNYRQFRQAVARLPATARVAHLADLGLRRLGQVFAR